MFNKSGVLPEPKKSQLWGKRPRPNNKEAVPSFLVMATYCGRFITKPCHNIKTTARIVKDVLQMEMGSRQNTRKHENQIKDIISQQCTYLLMVYFKHEHQTEVVVDTSPICLGAMLVQYDTEGNRSHYVPIP